MAYPLKNFLSGLVLLGLLSGSLLASPSPAQGLLVGTPQKLDVKATFEPATAPAGSEVTLHLDFDVEDH